MLLRILPLLAIFGGGCGIYEAMLDDMSGSAEALRGGNGKGGGCAKCRPIAETCDDLDELACSADASCIAETEEGVFEECESVCRGLDATACAANAACSFDCGGGGDDDDDDETEAEDEDDDLDTDDLP
jgi:hypothetical protein